MMTSSNSYSQGIPLIQGNSVIFGVWDTYFYRLNKTTADFLLQKIIKEINDSKNEFVFITGNLTNRGDDDELKFLFSGKTFDSRKEYYFWCLGYVYLFFK